MLDLETLGVRPGCKILSVGAVVFGPAGLGAEFYSEIDVETQPQLTTDPDTFAWWQKQAPAARDRLFSREGKEALSTASVCFEGWLARVAPDALVWGNGADFDNVILSAAYTAQGLKQPWGPWNGRCYRTLKALRPDVKLVRSGTHHNALDDAKSQAEHAVRILNASGGWELARGASR
jgi:exodeoxyribonuclease VIII